MGRHWDGWGYPHLAIKEGFIQMRQIRCGGRLASKFIERATDANGFAFKSSLGQPDFSSCEPLKELSNKIIFFLLSLLVVCSFFLLSVVCRTGCGLWSH